MLFNVCLLQHLIFLFENPPHIFHIGIEMDAIIFVLPIIHNLCWKYVTINFTLLEDLSRTIGPLFATMELLCILT